MASSTWVWVSSGVGDGQRSLLCCSSWGHKESDTTATELKTWLSLSMVICTGVGNGYPLQCSKFHGQWGLAGCSSTGGKQSDTAKYTVDRLGVSLGQNGVWMSLHCTSFIFSVTFTLTLTLSPVELLVYRENPLESFLLPFASSLPSFLLFSLTDILEATGMLISFSTLINCSTFIKNSVLVLERV